MLKQISHARSTKIPTHGYVITTSKLESLMPLGEKSDYNYRNNECEFIPNNIPLNTCQIQLYTLSSLFLVHFCVLCMFVCMLACVETCTIINTQMYIFMVSILGKGSNFLYIETGSLAKSTGH